MTTRRGGDSLKVGNWIVDKDEALQVSDGCEPLDDPLHDPLHDPLAPQRRQMPTLRPVVEALVLAMLGIQAHPGSGRAIRTGLVSDNHAWRAGLAPHAKRRLFALHPVVLAGGRHYGRKVHAAAHRAGEVTKPVSYRADPKMNTPCVHTLAKQQKH